MSADWTNFSNTAKKLNLSQYLFSYGTLQSERVQVELFGRIFKGSPDILREYKIAPARITDTQFLARGEQLMQHTLVFTNNKNDLVKGTLYEVSDAELLLADQYEPENYKRKKVELESGRSAWIYITNP